MVKEQRRRKEQSLAKRITSFDVANVCILWSLIWVADYLGHDARPLP